MEVQRYDVSKSKNSQPIGFWRSSKSQYPLLAALAFKYLPVPATSVPTEQIFSTAGLVVSKLCASTTPELVSKILFLNKRVKH